jgi:hypothetical protein
VNVIVCDRSGGPAGFGVGFGVGLPVGFGVGFPMGFEVGFAVGFVAGFGVAVGLGPKMVPGVGAVGFGPTEFAPGSKMFGAARFGGSSTPGAWLLDPDSPCATKMTPARAAKPTAPTPAKMRWSRGPGDRRRATVAAASFAPSCAGSGGEVPRMARVAWAVAAVARRPRPSFRHLSPIVARA